MADRYGKMLEEYEAERRASREAQTTLGVYRAQLQTAKDEIARYETMLCDQGKELAEDRRELEKLRATRHQKRSESESEEEEAGKGLQHERFAQEVNGKIYQLERENELHKALRAYQKDLSELQVRVAELGRENEALRSKSATTGMEQKLAETEARLVSARKELENARGELAAETARNDRLQEHLRLLEEAGNATRAELEGLLKHSALATDAESGTLKVSITGDEKCGRRSSRRRNVTGRS